MMLNIEIFLCMFEHLKYSTCWLWMELIIRKHIQRATKSYIWGDIGLGQWMREGYIWGDTGLGQWMRDSYIWGDTGLGQWMR